MLACIYKSPFKRKSPSKGTSPFKWKVIRSNRLRRIYLKELRLVVSDKQSFKKKPFKKQI